MAPKSETQPSNLVDGLRLSLQTEDTYTETGTPQARPLPVRLVTFKQSTNIRNCCDYLNAFPTHKNVSTIVKGGVSQWPISGGRRNSTRIDERHGKPLDTDGGKEGRAMVLWTRPLTLQMGGGVNRTCVTPPPPYQRTTELHARAHVHALGYGYSFQRMTRIFAHSDDFPLERISAHSTVTAIIFEGDCKLQNEPY